LTGPDCCGARSWPTVRLRRRVARSADPEDNPRR
jgi:hypothetical protein